MLAIHAIAKPNRNIPLCLIFPAIFLLFELNIGATQTIKNQASGSETLHSSTKNCEESADLCHKKSRRYVLYDVNPGEGFNLRRDIFIRVAPLVKLLNKLDVSHEWVLVLPPFGLVPHWKRTSPDIYFPWKTFFQIDKIQEYIPAIEMKEYMDEFGYDNPLDEVLQLQHFPFEEDSDWSDRIESGVRCDYSLEYRRSPETKRWHGLFWNQPIQARMARCMAFRGQSAALAKFILENDYRSVMFDRAEVILWDSYGDSNFWTARQSLVFASRLQHIALDFIIRNGLTPSINISLQQDSSGRSENNNTKLSLRREYLAAHLRRADFMLGRLASELPTIPSTARQILHQLRIMRLADVFIATDATRMEVAELKNHIYEKMPGATVYTYRSEKLSDGECAIIDQIICSYAKNFVGTRDSTFTLRIFEEREIFGFAPAENFNYLCPDTKETLCEKATQWRKT